MKIHKKQTKLTCYKFKVFSLLVASLSCNYGLLAMDPEDAGRQNQGPALVRQKLSDDELFKLSPDELEVYNQKMALISSIIKSRDSIETGQISLQKKRDEMLLNKDKQKVELETQKVELEKRKGELSSMKRKEKLNEKYEDRERNANLTKTMTETLALEDRSNAEVMHLHLKNVQLTMELQEQNRKNTQGIFGKGKNFLTGNDNSIDIKNYMNVIQNKNNQQRLETQQRFNALIEASPLNDRHSPRVEEVNTSDEDSDDEKKSDEE